ncbi:MAG: DUF402 domain-containing protein [Defluviitaleaceae bacterium]|nr:DUF402 domain-containing protein [Defluviitaleaceae bacterium]
MERKKYLGQYNKPFIKSINSKTARADSVGIPGYASLIKIIEVYHPYVVGEGDAAICIADNGYSELTFLPDNENWQMCAIYDDRDNIVEWYFDITRKNTTDESGNPYCDDLYLDAALMPDGRILTFDEDELADALRQGNITQDDHDMAYRTLEKLIAGKIISIDYMNELCTRLLALFQ